MLTHTVGFISLDPLDSVGRHTSLDNNVSLKLPLSLNPLAAHKTPNKTG